MGCGRFIVDDFLAVYADDGTLAPPMVSAFTNMDADADTVVSKAVDGSSLPAVGGGITIVTDADDNDGVNLFAVPYGTIVKNSSAPIFFEARVQVADADQDAGFFCGLIASTGLDEDAIKDACALMGDHTAIGFFAAASAGKMQAIAQKKVGAGTAAVTVIDADVTLNDALGDDAAALADATYYKFGMRFDGNETVFAYVNGVEVARWTLDIVYYDPAAPLCFAIAGKTGAAATYSFTADWYRVAYEAV